MTSTVGRIERIDQRTGNLASLDVMLADSDRVASASNFWRPDPNAGSHSGALFNWSAISAFWPERSVLCATWSDLSYAMMQLDDDHVLLRSRKVGARAVYVSFLEVAPQIRVGSWERRFIGLGAAMLTFAVVRSRQLGFEGRIGLHSVLQARGFYTNLGFHELDDPGLNEYWESYLELSPDAADRFMAKSSGA